MLGSPAAVAGWGQGSRGACPEAQARRALLVRCGVAARRLQSLRRGQSGQLHEDQARERADRAGRRHALQLLLLLHLQDDSNQ